MLYKYAVKSQKRLAELSSANRFMLSHGVGFTRKPRQSYIFFMKMSV